MAPPVIVALHGLGGDRSQPLALVADAAGSEGRVVAPDLRAHGSCTLDESAEHLTFARLAADVEAEVGPADGSVVLVGVSMGAALALELVSRGVLDVRGLVLVRPAWLWEPHPANLAAYPRIAALLRRQGATAGKARFIESRDHATVAAVSVAAADALAAQFDAPRAVERAARLERFPASAPRRIPALAIPALVLAGERDPVHPVPLAEALSADLGADLRIVPPRYDAPDEHARQVSDEIRRMVEAA